MSNSIALKEEIEEFQQMMEEELERVHPSYSDYELPASMAMTRDGKIVPVTDHDLEKVQKFAEEFDAELNDPDTSKKIMLVMDISIHNGETPDQLRRTIDEKGIEAVYQVRMSIHLAAKEMGVSLSGSGTDSLGPYLGH